MLGAVEPLLQALVLGLGDAMCAFPLRLMTAHSVRPPERSLGSRTGRVLGRSRSYRGNLPSQASVPPAAQRSRSGCAIRSVEE